MDEERKKDNAVDRVNRAYNTYQNVKSLIRLGKAVRSARVISALAATSEIWAPIAIALGLILFFTIIIMVMTGGPGAASETESQQQPTAPQITNTSSLFTTTNNGNAISDSDFYNVLKDAFSYPLYTKLLTERGAFNVVFNPALGDFVGCSASVNGRHTISFYGFSQCSLFDQKYLALHESGHILGNRNGDVFKSFPYSELKQKDFSCFSRLGFIRSYYHAETGAGTDPKDESFAEAVAMSLIKRKGVFKDFPSECPNTYNWTRSNIFK